MSSAISPIIRKHPVIAFVLVSYGLSWSALLLDQVVLPDEPKALHVFLDYFAKFGPSIAGIVLTLLAAGKSGLVKLVRALVLWRVHPIRYVLAFLLPFVLWAVALSIGRVAGEPAPDFDLALASAFAPVVFFLTRFFLGGGLGEEIGWRGVLLPALQQKHSALVASLIIGLYWGLWHAPVQFMADDVAIVEGIVNTILFTLYVTALSVIFTWHFNATGGSVLLCVTLHAAMNATNSYLETVIANFDAIENAVIWYGLTALGLAIVLTLTRGKTNLAGKERVTDSPLDAKR